MMRMRILKLFYLVVMVTTGVSSEIEPQCVSRFDYDFKMLEKVHDLSEQLKQLGDKVKQQDESINRMSSGVSKGSKRHVSFMASLSTGIENPNEGDVIIFDVVTLNAGDAYSGETGLFRAPVHGIYRFDLVLSSRKRSRTATLHLNIMHNDQTAAYVFLDGNTDYWIQRSINAVLELRKDDVIKTKVVRRHGDAWVDGKHFFCTFTGFLVQDMN